MSAIDDLVELYKGKFTELFEKFEKLKMERNELHAEVSDYRERFEWVSVNDRLPDDDIVVLVNGECFYFAIMSEGQWWTKGEVIPNVTHWMHLPDEPEPPEVME